MELKNYSDIKYYILEKFCFFNDLKRYMLIKVINILNIYKK
jgi:hypothetical protein